MSRKEAHCFDAELGRLQLHTDADSPAVSHWIVLIKQALDSERGKTNSTEELFAYVQGMYPAALVHLLSLRAEDPEVWERVLRDPLMRLEMGISEEEAQRRLEDASDGMVRLPCGHTIMEHQQLIDGWYVRNIEDTKFRRATLYRTWDLPPKERTHGKQFIARYDMDPDRDPWIGEEIARRNSYAEKNIDPETRSHLEVLGRTPDEIDEVFASMRRAREQEVRTMRIEWHERNFRILE